MQVQNEHDIHAVGTRPNVNRRLSSRSVTVNVRHTNNTYIQILHGVQAQWRQRYTHSKHWCSFEWKVKL